MLPRKLRKCQFLPVNQNLSSEHFSLAKLQLGYSNLSLAMIWQMTYNHKLPKLCSATLIGGCLVEVKPYVDLKDAAYPSKSIMTIRLAFWLPEGEGAGVPLEILFGAVWPSSPNPDPVCLPTIFSVRHRVISSIYILRNTYQKAMS